MHMHMPFFATLACLAAVLITGHSINTWYHHAYPDRASLSSDVLPQQLRSTGAVQSHAPALQLPFVASDAVVTGFVSAEFEALYGSSTAGWARATRVLLHGKRRPSRYTVCPTCTLVRCSDTLVCSGHCKQARRLFTCHTRGRSFAICSGLSRPDPATLPPDRLDPVRSMHVTAPEPFIGCANITGLPTGCPAAGTNGTTGTGRDYTVLWTRCEQQLYNVTTCGTGSNASQDPFYPYGYCTCRISYAAGELARATVPCSLPELDYTNPRPRDTGGTTVRVFADGNLTQTAFGDRDDDAPDVLLTRESAEFTIRGADVDVELRVWEAVQMKSDNLTVEAPFGSA
eukprot:jgi/Ulvmu1/8601/UM045_0044.1